jgi:hypothetical protein
MTRGEDDFDHLASELTADPRVTRSTMMGLPCLRWDGRFFASFDRRTGKLVVKLPEGRVDELISSGQAESFAPAGRRFREWASIEPARTARWSQLLDEALTFVSDE